MDDNIPVTDDFPVSPRLPLITLAEAREVVEVLVVAGAGDGEIANQARRLAGDLAARIPSQ